MAIVSVINANNLINRINLPNNEIITYDLIQSDSSESKYLEKYESVLNRMKQWVFNNNWKEVGNHLDDFRFLFPTIVSEYELNNARNNSVFLIFLTQAFNLFVRSAGLNYDGLTLIVTDPARFYSNFILGGPDYVYHEIITNILILVKVLNLTGQYISLLHLSLDVVQSFPQHISKTISNKWISAPRI